MALLAAALVIGIGACTVYEEVTRSTDHDAYCLGLQFGSAGSYERVLRIATGEIRADGDRRSVTRLLPAFIRAEFDDEAPPELHADAVIVRQGVRDAQDLHITDADLERYLRAFDHLSKKGRQTCPDLPDE